MIRQVEINSKVLNVLLEIVQDEKIPVKINIGEKHIDYNGTTSYDILYEYDSKDADVINATICKAINLTFDLIDD